ncbi:MAG: flagellar hook assembly protein FlgD [Candidatus Binatia bacterium]|nr:flagellar hook assembly protein FlgD [Candidatus Binatia bacterium]
MELQSISPAGSGQQGGMTAAAGAITQDAFLHLLIVQLQNQDPLNPLDNQEFIAQLATFNSLDQLIGINAKLDTLRTEQLRLGQLEATALIGKEIRAQGNQLDLGRGEEVELRYRLAADVARVVINITDSEGTLVRTLELGAQTSGEQRVVWDGKDNMGNPLDSGMYTFEVNAFDINGGSVAGTTFLQGVVTGVDMTGSEPILTIGDLQVPVSAVMGVQARA